MFSDTAIIWEKANWYAKINGCFMSIDLALRACFILIGEINMQRGGYEQKRYIRE